MYFKEHLLFNRGYIFIIKMLHDLVSAAHTVGVALGVGIEVVTDQGKHGAKL